MASPLYRPRCSVCQFMKRNPEFRYRIVHSSYYSEAGHESPDTINKSFGNRFKLVTIYSCLQRHHATMKIKAPVPLSTGTLVGRAIEAPVTSTTEHEIALDEFIREGRNKLSRGELIINAPNLIAAIKTKAEIEKSTKDRRLDAIKAFFVTDKKEINESSDARPSLPEGQS